MPASREFTISLGTGYWDLQRQGPIDQDRFKKKAWELIRENLPHIVSDEAIIIDGDKGRKFKIPLGGPEQPRFRFNPSQQKWTGQGKDKQIGDIVAPGQKGVGSGGKPGEEPGQEWFEMEVTREELMEAVFKDLALPNFVPKRRHEIQSEEIVYSDVRKTGILSNLDKKRTVKEGIKRRALESGDPHFKDIKMDDLRFRAGQPGTREVSNAVVLAMMDVSGSMGEFEKYIARSFYWWLTEFLRRKYDQAKIVYIAHHTEAQEVTEDEFFHRGESGGTKVSSAYQLALNIIEERFPPADWNIYPFHFSDGENIPWDNEQSVKLMEGLVKCSSAAGYGEIRTAGSDFGRLMTVFTAVKDPRFRAIPITKKEDLWPALKNFLSQEGVEGWVSRV